MNCSKCGNQINSNDKFCKNCGVPVEINCNNNIHEINNFETQNSNNNTTHSKLPKFNWKVLAIIGLAIFGLMVITPILKTLTNFFTSDLHNNSVNSVADQLETKYGKSFSEYGANGTYLYMYPNDDSTLVFTVRADKDNKIISENYSKRYVERQLENLIKQSFSQNGMQVVVTAALPLPNSDRLQTLNEYITDRKPDSVSVSILIDGSLNVDNAKLENMYKNFYDSVGKVNFGSGVYVLSHSDYSKVADKILHHDGIWDTSIINVYSDYTVKPVKEYSIRYNEQGFAITEQ